MLARQIWAAVIDRARENLTLNSGVSVWLGPCEAIGITDSHLVIAAPRQSLEWLQRRWLAWLGDAVREVSELDGIVIRPMEEK